MRRLVLVGAVVLLVGAGFAVVTFADADSGGRYRTATVAVGDVSQTVSVSGTVDRVNRANVSFGTSGALASLTVAVGDSVSAGQELGTLDMASLQAAVDKAQSDLDQADAALTSAEDAVEEASDEPASDGLVQEVKEAQSKASAALKTAADAVAAQQSACADPTAPACAAAGAATLQAQQAVKAAQDQLQAKLNALSAASSSADSSRSGPNGSASSVAEAQATVDQSKVKLVEAQQALAGATLTSPITGTVASVATGTQFSAGTTVVVVVGEGAADVTATVPVEQLSKLAAGQPATVTPVGTTAKIAGKVTRVSTTPDPNAETVAYPVTITIDKPPATMAAGSSATASIVVATARGVLTVPTSAVNRGTVTVLADDQTTVTPVTVGAVGPTRTEIKEGVTRGEEVVLANLDTPLPTGNSQNEGGFLGGGPEGGRFGGGGGGGPVVRRSGGN